MTGGYDPMQEVADALDAATAPPRAPTSTRVVPVAPPPRPQQQPATPHDSGADAVPVATVPSPTPKRRTRPGNLRRLPPGPEIGRTTTATFPLQLIDRLQRLRLDRAVAAKSFNLTTFFNEAVNALPIDANGILDELDRYAAMLNVGRRPGNDGYLPEGRFGIRISATAEHTVAIVIRDLYNHTGRRFDKQDLWALALLRALSDHER